MGNKINVKKSVGLLFLVIGILSLVYSAAAKAYSVSFSGFFLPAGILSMAIGLAKLLLKPPKSKLMIFMVKSVNALIILGLISFIFIEALILSSSIKRETNKPDYIVVLGAGLWGDRPSLTLQQRLYKSLDLIKLHPDVKVIVSGGQGPGETITEAEAMRRFLVKRGVEENLIIKEDRSTSTLENLSYTREIIRNMDSRDDIKITIVTSNFHMFRSKFLAKRVDFKPYGYPSEIAFYLIPTYYTREFLAVIKSFLFDRPVASPPHDIGIETGSYKGVPVYNNGKDYVRNYGKNYSKDGYYYGYKWQCVEYIKRFYYDAKEHKMPDGFGHAKDFFDSKLDNGALNKLRNLYQYKNGQDIKPEPDDLIVFNDGTYGHVAIITEVGKDYIEVIQQNIYKKPRERFSLTEKDGKYTVGTGKKPVGWLRKRG
jgi:uncharacterized SAM-binding protein YcdF (DUF218 family)/surface antigen